MKMCSFAAPYIQYLNAIIDGDSWNKLVILPIRKLNHFTITVFVKPFSSVLIVKH